MQLAMVPAAQGNRELVAHLATERPLLRETQMMRVGRRSAADQKRLTRHRFQLQQLTPPRPLIRGRAGVRVVVHTPRLSYGEPDKRENERQFGNGPANLGSTN